MHNQAPGSFSTCNDRGFCIVNNRVFDNDLSRAKVLSSIWQEDPFTKMDIVRKAHLSLPTVTNVLADLENEGYVLQAGNGISRGGRPPSLYRFNPTARYTIGVQIYATTAQIGLVDLFENIVGSVEYPFMDDATTEFVLVSLIEGIRNLLSTHRVGIERLLGLGLGIPGFVDRETGVWLGFPWAPALKNVPLSSFLEREFQVPVLIRNEVNVHADAELHYGHTPTEKDMLLVTCHEGLKASVVVDGQILSGKHGNFGSVGHLVVEENGRPCFCGARGCLEMYASGRAIRGLVAERPDLLARLGGNPNAPYLAHRVLELARKGDADCQALVEDILPLMARAFASMIRFTDIDTLVLLGAYIEGGDYLRNRLHEEISARLPDMVRANLSIYLGGNEGIDRDLAAAAAPLIRAHFELPCPSGPEA
jgi:predicted NBD/HSP70 family sugar kinase